MTTKQTNNTTVVIVPDLFFPSLPDPDGFVFLDADGNTVTDDDTEIVTVNVPWEYLVQLADFKLDYDEAREYYFALKKGYNSVVDSK